MNENSVAPADTADESGGSISADLNNKFCVCHLLDVFATETSHLQTPQIVSRGHGQQTVALDCP